jgi:anaerobic selenocysteine-containing dehydrogenase
MSEKTREMHARIDGAEVSRSICPYCGVGCGQLIFHKDGKLVSIEGDPESPISQGNLCPKGAASYQLLTHSRRETKMKYRAPRSKEWTEISLERAMDMVEHARELVIGSFELFSSQTALRTNDAMRGLTFVTVVTGLLATLVGALGMNFEASFFGSNDTGFWMAVGGLALFAAGAFVLGRHRRWF